MPIDKYFKRMDYCIQYANDDNQPYTVDKIINNDENAVVATVMYK